MKGKIFIGWSGNDEIARVLSSELCKNEYQGIVGGQSGQSRSLYVGDTVIREIDSCNQAVFIVQKKNEAGISGNLLFELGYSLSRFDKNKIHIFYIDIERGDKSIPSDLDGVWANFYTFSGNEEVAEKIVCEFLKNQKNIVSENKMAIINSHNTLKDNISKFSIAPFCSEYELAQYVVFLCHSAYLWGQENEVVEIFKTLFSSIKQPSEELETALDLGYEFLDTFNNLTKDGSALYLERKIFRKCKRKLNDIIDKVKLWKEDDFANWILATAYDIINYIHILYSAVPENSAEDRVRILKESTEYAFECLKCCDNLGGRSENKQVVYLLRAYMYRNLATANFGIAEVEKSDETVKIGVDYLIKSLNERELLFNYYQNHPINSKLYEIFEMEYYLALSESIIYIDDKDEYREVIKDCDEYIDRTKILYKDKSFFINKIENSLTEIKNTWE